jgi:DNA-binding NarL/FixJ family response regulator
MRSSKIRVAILDDHQSIIDGYIYRLQNVSEIEVVITATYSNDLEKALKKQPVDVLLLDISVPISESDPTPSPALYFIAKLLQQYPNLSILPISMYTERALIKAAVEAGASGYIFKDDRVTLRKIGSIIQSVANGGVYFSHKAHEILLKEYKDSTPLLTTRQVEVLSLFAAYPHMTSAQAAQRLDVADSTIRNILSAAYLRLNVPNRNSAILKAQQLKLLPEISPQIVELGNYKDIMGEQ